MDAQVQRHKCEKDHHNAVDDEGAIFYPSCQAVQVKSEVREEAESFWIGNDEFRTPLMMPELSSSGDVIERAVESKMGRPRGTGHMAESFDFGGPVGKNLLFMGAIGAAVRNKQLPVVALYRCQREVMIGVAGVA